MVKRKFCLVTVMVGLAFLLSIASAGCGPGVPEGCLTCGQFWGNPVYFEEIALFGEVSMLGELDCPCFHLTSGGDSITVWYDSMVEDNGTEKPPVSVEGIANGDQVVVFGELRREGKYVSLNDFWAHRIKKY